MLKRCYGCGQPLYQITPEGIKIKEGNGKEIFIEGVIKITCEKGHETLLKEDTWTN